MDKHPMDQRLGFRDIGRVIKNVQEKRGGGNHKVYVPMLKEPPKR